jgi:hypothetical protein
MASKADLLDQIEGDPFMNGYFECLFFTEEDSLSESWLEAYGEEPEDDDYGSVDVSEFAFTARGLKQIISDCKDFKAACAEEGLDLDKWGQSKAGHDFWLTRNGHGAGFWDRGRKDGDALTKIAKSFGAINVAVGETGDLYYE